MITINRKAEDLATTVLLTADKDIIHCSYECQNVVT